MELSIASSIEKEFNNSSNPSLQSIRRPKKRGNKSRKKEEKISDGPNFENEGFSQHFNSKPEKRILYKKMLSEFEIWMSWQRKILLCGLTEKCTRSFLRTLCTVFEPIFHLKAAPGFGKKAYMITHRPTDLNDITERVRKLTIGPEYSTDNLDHRTTNLIQEAQSTAQQTQSLEKNKDPIYGFENKPATDLFLPKISCINSKIASTHTLATGESNQAYNINDHKHESAKPLSSTSTNNFFPRIMTSRTKRLGKICSMRKIAVEGPGQNSSIVKTFKNQKWWISSTTEQSEFCAPKGKRLMESFRSTLDIVHMWFNKWNDAEKGDCILQLLSACQHDELEYFSQCIVQRLKDRTDIDTLPDALMIKIFKHLSNDELCKASEVSKRWYSISSESILWRKKCKQLGEENGLNDVISQIEASARGSEINWRIAFGDLLQSLNQRNARLQELASQENNNTSDSEDQAESFCSSSYNSDDDDDYATTKDASEYHDVEDELSRGSSVSGMSEYLNGGLDMIEDTVQQLSAKSQHDESRDEETALDIRPEQSVQARNKLASNDADEGSFRFVNVDGIRALKRVRKLQGHLEPVLALQFDKKRVMTGSADRTLRVWDARSGRSVHKLKGHKGGIRALKFDKQFIFTASWDMTIMVWDVVKFKRITTLHGHQDCVSCLETTDDILLSGSHDKTIKIWCKDTWKCLRTLTGHQGTVTCVTLLEDDAILSGSSDRTIRLWDLETYSYQRVFRGSKDVILTVQVCGDLLGAGCHDGHLLFWNLQSGRCEASIVAHNGPLHALSFCGARFVTAGGDQLVKEWDLATCCCLRSLTGHKDVVLCVQASPRRIVSGSADGTVRIWDMEGRIRI